jgi:hypothetical protein
MLVVKLFSWEHSVVERIKKARDRELRFVKKYAYGIAAIMSVIVSGVCSQLPL